MGRVCLLVATIIAALLPAFETQAASTLFAQGFSPLEKGIVAATLLWTIAVVILLRHKKVLTAEGLGKSNRSPNACSPMLWLAIAFLLYAASMLGTVLTAQAVGMTASPDLSLQDAAILSTGTYTVSIVACLMAVLFIQKRDPLSGLRCTRTGILKGLLASVLLVPVLWFLSFVLVTTAEFVTPLLGLPEPDPIAHATLDMLVSSPRDLWWWLLVAGALVGAPIVEEILYRGVLQAALRASGLRVVPAVLITSLFFVLPHLGAVPSASWLTALPMLFALSVMLGIIMERTGSIAAPILLHAAFNASNLILSLVGT